MAAHGGQEKSRNRRWLRRAAAGAAFLLLAAALALWSGRPQRIAVKYLAGHALAADVDVEDVALFGRVRGGAFRIYDGPGERTRGSYTVDLRGLDLDYSILAVNSRPFQKGAIQDLVIRLDGTNPRDTNYDFAMRLLAESQTPAEEEASGRSFVPNSLAINSIAVSLKQPGYDFGVRGLGLSMAAEGDALVVHVKGDAVAGWFGLGQNARQISVDQGLIDLEMRQTSQEVRVRRAQASLPGLLELGASGSWRLGADTCGLSATLEVCQVQGAGLSGVLDGVSPVLVRFDTLDLSGTRVSGELTGTGMVFDPSVLQASMQSLAVGTPGHELLLGGLTVTGTLEESAGQAVIALGRGQRITADWAGGPGAATVSLLLDAWSVEDLRDALPVDFRPALDGITGLAGVAGSGTLTWDQPQYTVDAQVAPVFTDSPSGQNPFQLSVKAKGRTTAGGPDEPLIDGACTLRLGGGEAAAAGIYRSADSFRGAANLTGVDPWLLLGAALGMDPLLDLPDARVSGMVSIRSTEGVAGDVDLRISGLGADATGAASLVAACTADLDSTQPASIQGNLAIPGTERTGTAAFALDASPATGEGSGLVTFTDVDPFRIACLLNLIAPAEAQYAILNGTISLEKKENRLSLVPELILASAALGEWVLSEGASVSLGGKADWDRSGRRLTAQELILRLGEDGELGVSNGTWDLVSGAAEGSVAGRVDLDYAGPALGLSGVYGEWSLDAPVQYEAGILKGSATLTGNGAGFGGFSTPYGTPVTAGAGFSYDLAAGQGSLEAVEVTWPPATRLTSSTLSFNLDPLAVEGAFAVTSDLTPLVDMAFLDSVEGHGEVTGTVTTTDGAMGMTFDLESTAENLVLTGGLAALTGPALRGTGRLNTGGIEADGEARAAETAVAGAVLRGLAAPVHIRGWTLAADGFEAELFDGSVKGNVAIDLASGGFPGRLSAEVHELDLATFCKEFEPPGARLTGTASGQVVVEWNADGLAALEIGLACEEGFTMNRELIEQLLLKQVLGDAAGTKRLGKIRDKVIGDDPQRPFDRAELTLRLEGGMLTGEVKLPSEQLNLVLDLHIDPRNIVKAMELRQKAQLSQIDGISTEADTP